MSPVDPAANRAVVQLTGRLTTARVDGFDVDFTSWGFYELEPWRNYWHRHSFFEVCLAYAGEGRFSHGDDEFSVAGGDVFLARPGVLHEIESSTTDPLGITFWGFDLSARRDGPRAGEPGWWSGLYAGGVVSRRTGTLPSLLAGLAAEAAEPRSGHGSVSRALGAALVVETGRAFTEPDQLVAVPAPLDRSQQAYEQMHRYLLDNLAAPMTVRDVAAAVHLSERHAERLFRSQAGVSLMNALRRLRVERAASLLRDGDLSVAAVASAVGYADLPSFRSAFRTVTGQSPQEFRRTNGTVTLG